MLKWWKCANMGRKSLSDTHVATIQPIRAWRDILDIIIRYYRYLLIILDMQVQQQIKSDDGTISYNSSWCLNSSCQYY
jgi:hypothetical protein